MKLGHNFGPKLHGSYIKIIFNLCQSVLAWLTKQQINTVKNSYYFSMMVNEIFLHHYPHINCTRNYLEVLMQFWCNLLILSCNFTKAQETTPSLQELKIQKQTKFTENTFSKTFSDKSSGLVFTITCNFSMNKQRKIVSNHQLTLHIPEQTNHHSEDVLYELSKCYSIKL